MPEPLMPKLGGSVVTRKGSHGVDNGENIAMICREIGGHRDVPLLIIHGAGSCGHPEAERYRLMDGLSQENLEGVSATHRAVRRLNDALVSALREQAVEAVGLHPLHLCYAENGRIVAMEHRHIREMLSRSMVPVLHGDVVMDGVKGATIISGDQIVAFLGRALRFSRIGLATDVAGVLAGEAVIPVLTAETAMQVRIGSSLPTDKTGGMGGKITELLELARAGTGSEIFHATQIGAFLEGRPHGGTVVKSG